MTPQEILNLPVEGDCPGTLRNYLRHLLLTLWTEGEMFSGKRPFGNSGWQYDVYAALLRAGVVSGELDEDGCVNEVDEKAADKLIKDLILNHL